MVRRTMFLAALLSVCVFPAWSQSQNSAPGCDATPPENDDVPRSRTQVTWVKNSDGKPVPVILPVRQMKVARVIFVGDPSLPLLQSLTAKSLSEGDYDDSKDGLDELLDQIRDAWQEQGYFNVKVEHSGSQTLEEDSYTRTVAITVSVTAGKQYRLDEIRFGDATSSSPVPRLAPSPSAREQQRQFTAEQFRSFFPIQQGDVFDTHMVRQGLETLRKAYGERGFINFSAVQSTEIEEASGRITLVMDIAEGKQFYVGSIKAQGHDGGLVRKLQSSGFVTGKVFDTSRLDEFFEQNRSILPRDFKVEDSVERRINEREGIVDLIFKIPACQML